MRGIFFDKDVIELISYIKNCSYVNFESYYLCNQNNVVSNMYPSALSQIDLDNFKNIKSVHKSISIIVPKTGYNHNFIATCPERNREARICLENLSINKFYKGHKYNVKRSLKLGVNFKIIDNENICDSIMQDFFKAFVFSRSHINHARIHSEKSFHQRRKLIELKKAILGITEFEEKKSYVYVIYNSEEGFYFDCGHNQDKYPFTAHFCQYNIMKYLKEQGVKYYSLGVITPKEKYDVSIKSEAVDYYKNGFCNLLGSYEELK